MAQATAVPEVGLLMAAVKWVAMATVHLGAGGPQRILQVYESIWTIPNTVRQMLRIALDELPLPVPAEPFPNADDYIQVLLGLHGLVNGGQALAPQG